MEIEIMSLNCDSHICFVSRVITVKANICWCSGVSLLIKSKSIPDTLQLRPQTCYFRTQIRRKKILYKRNP